MADFDTLIFLAVCAALARFVIGRRRRRFTGSEGQSGNGGGGPSWDPPVPPSSSSRPSGRRPSHDVTPPSRSSAAPVEGRPSEQATADERRLETARSLDTLRALSPTEFELCIAAIFRQLDWKEVHRVGGPRDVAADLIGTDPEGRRVVIQCKRFGERTAVGSPVVQTVVAMARLHHSAERAVIVTTSRFTREARRLAELHRVDLIDGKELLALARRVNSASSAPKLTTRAETPTPVRVRLACHHVMTISEVPLTAISRTVRCEWCGEQPVVAVLDR